ncbi:MAG: helix-turn-helix domain-containing protein [Bacteroidales bacterium]
MFPKTDKALAEMRVPFLLSLPFIMSTKMDNIEQRKAIGEQFANARKAKGYSQIQLGQILNLPQRTVSRLEQGSQNMGIDTYILVGNHLGLDKFVLPPKNLTKI